MKYSIISKFLLCNLIVLGLFSCKNTNQSHSSIDSDVLVMCQDLTSTIDRIDYLMRIPDTYEVNEGLDPMLIDSVAVIWDSLKLQVKSRRLYDTYITCRDKHGALITHLYHSTMRYMYITEIYKPLLYEYEEPSSANLAYRDIVKFEYLMQYASIAYFEGDELYIPEKHTATIQEYGMALCECCQFQEALDLLEDLHSILILEEGNYCLEVAEVLAKYKASVYNYIKGPEAALDVLYEFREQVKIWQKDYITEPEFVDDCESYIKDLDKYMQQYINNAVCVFE